MSIPFWHLRVFCVGSCLVVGTRILFLDVCPIASNSKYNSMCFKFFKNQNYSMGFKIQMMLIGIRKFWFSQIKSKITRLLFQISFPKSIQMTRLSATLSSVSKYVSLILELYFKNSVEQGYHPSSNLFIHVCKT